MDVEPLWLTFDDVREIHAYQITRRGGLEGVKGEDLVHSAIASPQNLYHYGHVEDPLELGIQLCAAIAGNHGFNDGNKRTATAAMVEFLAINGFDLVVPDDEPDTPVLGQWVEKLVTGSLSHEQLYDRLIGFVQEHPPEY